MAATEPNDAPMGLQNIPINDLSSIFGLAAMHGGAKLRPLLSQPTPKERLMRKSIVGALLLLCLAHANSSGAQSPASATVSPLPALIQSFSGHWTLSVKFEPASGMPPGTEGKGEETWRAAVGGKTLLSEESWKAGPADMSLLGIIWWDSKENKLHAMDCNNQGKSICDPKDAAGAVVLTWKGGELTIEEPERGPDGKLVTSRVTFKDIKSDSFSEIDSLELTPGKFETMMTIHAVRTLK